MASSCPIGFTEPQARDACRHATGGQPVPRRSPTANRPGLRSTFRPDPTAPDAARAAPRPPARQAGPLSPPVSDLQPHRGRWARARSGLPRYLEEATAEDEHYAARELAVDG